MQLMPSMTLAEAPDSAMQSRLFLRDAALAPDLAALGRLRRRYGWRMRRSTGWQRPDPGCGPVTSATEGIAASVDEQAGT